MRYIILVLSFLFVFFGFTCFMAYHSLLFGLSESMEIPIVIFGIYEYQEIKMQLIGQDIGVIVFIVISLLLGTWLYSLYHRMSKKKKDTLDKNAIEGPFILYLRSFADDITTSKAISTYMDVRTEEEVLVDVFSDIAPVYAIGDPKDKKMPLGASRIYVNDDEWKATVMEMAQKAELVVLRLGKTDSFWWEVEMAMEKIPIEKNVFVVPESKTFDNVAVLYKILLDHNIDIRNLSINVEEKHKGSISSILYFDKEGNPRSVELKMARFTGMFISYEKVLRKALNDFRARYGLNPSQAPSIRKARVFQALVILYLIFISGSRTFSDMVSLRYQMPYEMVESCVQNESFVQKYSDEINGTNLMYAIMESYKGRFLLDDEEFMYSCLVEMALINTVSYGELVHIEDESHYYLLMVKKYMPEQYDTYLSVMSRAAVTAVAADEEELNNLMLSYKNAYVPLPEWLTEAAENAEDECDVVRAIADALFNHLEDKDIIPVMRTLYANGIR